MQRHVILAAALMLWLPTAIPAQARRPDAVPRKASQPREVSDEEVAGAAAAATGFSLLAILGFLCMGFIGLLLYFLPVFVAGFRGHQNTIAISVLTIFLGWSVIGWVVALIWAFTEVRRRRRVVSPDLGEWAD